MSSIINRPTVVVTAIALTGLVSSGGVALAHGSRRGTPPGTGQLVHGLSVVKTATGFATKAQQYGTVTAVSPTSLGVVSADGFTATYALTTTTVTRTPDTVAVGDTVAVVADGASTATRVDER